MKYVLLGFASLLALFVALVFAMLSPVWGGFLYMPTTYEPSSSVVAILVEADGNGGDRHKVLLPKVVARVAQSQPKLIIIDTEAEQIGRETTCLICRWGIVPGDPGRGDDFVWPKRGQPRKYVNMTLYNGSAYPIWPRRVFNSKHLAYPLPIEAALTQLDSADYRIKKDWFWIGSQKFPCSSAVQEFGGESPLGNCSPELYPITPIAFNASRPNVKRITTSNIGELSNLNLNTKIVIIGLSSDLFLTPMGAEMPRAVIHADAVSQLLAGFSIYNLAVMKPILLVIILCLVSVLGILYGLLAIPKAFFVFGSIIFTLVLVVGSLASFKYFGVYLPYFSLVFPFFVSAFLCRFGSGRHPSSSEAPV